MKVLLNTETGSIKASKAILLPICKIVKSGKYPMYKYGLAEFGKFDYNGAFKDTEYTIEVEPTYDIIVGDIIDYDDIVVFGNLYEKEQNGTFYSINSIISDTPRCYRFIYELFQYGSGFFSRKLIRPYKGFVCPYCITDFVLSPDRKAVSIMTSDGCWGAINWKRNVIVPQGKYSWIDVFKNGLARVKGGKETNGIIYADTRWGLIDIEGKEVLPPIYSNLQIKGDYVYIEQNNKTNVILLKDLDYATYESIKDKDKESIECKKAEERERSRNKPDYDPHGKFDDSKAARSQIADAYEGETDTYWNSD